MPIIDELFQLGFGEYVNSVRRAGAIRLFPDWISPKSKNGFDRADAAWSNASWVRKFNRNVVPFAMGDRLPDNTRSPVTFHSFRGAFKAMLGLHQPHVAPNIINEVIGHSKGEMDNRYVGVVALEETYPAIRACRWNGLILPSSPG